MENDAWVAPMGGKICQLIHSELITFTTASLQSTAYLFDIPLDTVAIQ